MWQSFLLLWNIYWVLVVWQKKSLTPRPVWCKKQDTYSCISTFCYQLIAFRPLHKLPIMLGIEITRWMWNTHWTSSGRGSLSLCSFSNLFYSYNIFYYSLPTIVAKHPLQPIRKTTCIPLKKKKTTKNLIHLFLKLVIYLYGPNIKNYNRYMMKSPPAPISHLLN